jgi:hypothetical protein
MAVRVVLPGDHGSFIVDDLTLDEAVAVERETGESWLHLNPVRSANQARAIMVQFLARSIGEDKARAEVGKMTVGEFSKAVEVVKDDRPDEFRDGQPVVDPKAVGVEPGTT